MRAQFGVVVPIRTFALANTRLSDALTDDARAALARQLADTVARAAGDAPVIVVTSAPEVEHWARRHTFDLAPDPGSLDGAAAAGSRHLLRAACRGPWWRTPTSRSPPPSIP